VLLSVLNAFFRNLCNDLGVRNQSAQMKSVAGPTATQEHPCLHVQTFNVELPLLGRPDAYVVHNTAFSLFIGTFLPTEMDELWKYECSRSS
jgi:hypothetical protein